MATVRLVKTRDNGKMIRQLREARKGTSEVQTVEIRETVLDDEVIKEINNVQKIYPNPCP